jgi:hypothetical protein
VTRRNRLLLILGACLVALPAAALLVPTGHSHDRSTVNTAHAAAALKSGIWPAAERWRDDTRADRDGDGQGEFPFIHELAAASDAASGSYLPASFRGDAPVVGYRFVAWLPDGTGGAMAARDASPDEQARIDAQERFWVAYAWPAEPAAGSLMFAILPDGVLRHADWTGQAPDWSAVWGVRDWHAAPVWQPYRR